jgi:hypothetical protein
MSQLSHLQKKVGRYNKQNVGQRAAAVVVGERKMSREALTIYDAGIDYC